MKKQTLRNSIIKTPPPRQQKIQIAITPVSSRSPCSRWGLGDGDHSEGYLPLAAHCDSSVIRSVRCSVIDRVLYLARVWGTGIAQRATSPWQPTVVAQSVKSVRCSVIDRVLYLARVGGPLLTPRGEGHILGWGMMRSPCCFNFSPTR